MKFKNYLVIAFLSILLVPSFALSQESEPVVIDEVVAQVNEGVITLSRVKRAMKEIVARMVAGGKTEAQAKAEVEGKDGELIANLVNEELMLQKGKELGLDSDVDAIINRRFVDIMKEQNIKNLEDLYRKMRENNINPEDIRAEWRIAAMRDAVWNREVDAKIYHSLNGKEIKDFYEKNKQKFVKPETVTLSEIFLNFAGRDEATVRAKAKDLVQQARNGGDFAKLAVENSDRPDVKDKKGKLGTMSMGDFKDDIAIPLKGLKAGQITEPIEVEEGLIILRVDERAGASGEPKFEEDEARNMLTFERAPEERKKFMITLRRDSYIKISESYRAMVSPILYAEERTDKPADKSSDKTATKTPDKVNDKPADKSKP